MLLQNPRNRADLTAFLLSLFLAFSFWLIHNLSQTYADVVSVPVVACSNISGRAEESSEEVRVVARCKGSGFYLLGLKLNSYNSPRKVLFESEDLRYEGGDRYSISQTELARYFQDIFGDDAQLESFVSRSVQFSFLPQTFRKVPVKVVRNITFRPQYMALREMSLSQDSVVVYGEPSRLETIDVVLTSPIYLRDIRTNVHGVVKLENPGGVRLSENEVIYNLDVVRYVEMRKKVKVSFRNVPEGMEIVSYPESVDAVFRCVFPYKVDLTSAVEMYVDYEDFEGSIAGKCVVRHDMLPEGVISCRLEPEVCECVEKLYL